MKTNLVKISVALALLALTGSSVSAAVQPIWNGSTSSWQTAGNWTGGIPGSGQDVTFTGQGVLTPTLSQNTPNLGTLTFSNTALLFDIGGAFNLTFGPNATITNNATVTETISANLSLGNGGPGGTTITNAGTLVITGTLDNGGKLVTLNGTGTGGSVTNNMSGAGALTKSGAGTWTLSGPNAYTGITTITQGVLQMGASNVFANTSNFVINGGTLAGNGFSDTMGTLTVGASGGILDFGTGGLSTFNFANSAAATWTGTLSIVNYVYGTSHLFFGTDNTALTATQLGFIDFTPSLGAGNPAAFTVANNGEVVPEPSTYAAIFGVAALGLVCLKRRREDKYRTASTQ